MAVFPFWQEISALRLVTPYGSEIAFTTLSRSDCGAPSLLPRWATRRCGSVDQTLAEHWLESCGQRGLPPLGANIARGGDRKDFVGRII